MGDQPALFASADFDVRAMSFREPWASAILRPVPVGATAPGPKRIDNRSRAPGERMGKWIAIRTTDTFDHEGLDWINRTYGYGWTRADKAPAGVILGVARVVGMVTEGSHPWFFGRIHRDKLNVGWMLGDVVAFEAPVPFVPRFGLGLQPLPADVQAKVRPLWLAALESDAATSTHKGLAAR